MKYALSGRFKSSELFVESEKRNRNFRIMENSQGIPSLTGMVPE
jgi:hypothetical protein